ncbi:hypothetical protein AC1031_021909 [Aphanomyces cochlioides]|nr:hypothetical protein AC1031_021909 [Aphanomyces cochlioides]
MKEKFAQWLKRTCKLFGEEMMSMGLSILDIGTHFFRKGVATALSNNPGGPQSVSIWLRAGWSLGNVQNRYIFVGSGGDQFVGRAATGLNVNEEEFACLPPHFHDLVLSVSEWERILLGYSTWYDERFRPVVPFLLASLVYHQDWIAANFPPKHPIFFSSVWTSPLLANVKKVVLDGFLKNSISNLVASGIPPQVALFGRMSKVETKLDSIIDMLHKQQEDVISTQVERQQSTPVTLSVLTNALTEMHARLLRDIGQQSSCQGLSTTNTIESRPQDLVQTFALPQPMEKKIDFFPAVRVFDMWRFWFDGFP